MILYHIFGTEYGWSPDEVDNAPNKTVQGLMILQQVFAAKAQTAQQDREKIEKLNESRNMVLRAPTGNIPHGG